MQRFLFLFSQKAEINFECNKLFPFLQQVIACWQRDVLVCLHENGSLSVRVRRKTHAISTPAPEGHGAFGKKISFYQAFIVCNKSERMKFTKKCTHLLF